MREGIVWKQDDIWPDLAPASREFLLTYSPGSDLDAAKEAAAKAIRLTGAAACRLSLSESRATVEGDLARLDLVFAIDGHPLSVGLHAEARAGVNAIRRWTSVRNTGTAPWLLHRLTTAAMMLRPGPDDLELQWVEACTHPSMGPRSPTRWRQATRHRELLGPATLRTLRSDAATRRADGRSSGCMAWLALRDPGRDGGLFAGWEWSGLFDADVGDFGTESGAGAFGLRMGFSDEGSYARQVAPGETFTTPRAFFGFFAGDAEEAGRATRKVAEQLFALPWPEGRPPMFVGYCTWSNWQDFGGSNRLHLRPERLDAEIARCRDLGVELFILDYDWFPLLGDFRSDLARFPDGVEAISRKVKAAGMKFGLWMGFGQAHADAPIVREHPEFLVTRNGKPVTGGWGMRSLCFASEPCREYVLGEISRVVERFGVDWLKQDFDIIPVSDSRGHAPHATDTRIESVEGYYWIKDRLRERFPKLYLDNWTPPMGGADFGNLQRHHSMLLCDDYHPTALRSTAREQAGPDARLIVDAALAYRTAAEGLSLYPLYREIGIWFLEAPLPLDDLDGHAEMAAHGLPLGVGDLGLTHVDEFVAFMERGGCSICQPDITMVGGFTGIERIAAAADARGRRVITHGYKTNIEIAANLHFLAARPQEEILEFSTSRSPIRWETTRERLPVEPDGCVRVPDRPGLGVTLDHDFVKANTRNNPVRERIAGE